MQPACLSLARAHTCSTFTLSLDLNIIELSSSPFCLEAGVLIDGQQTISFPCPLTYHLPNFGSINIIFNTALVHPCRLQTAVNVILHPRPFSEPPHSKESSLLQVYHNNIIIIIGTECVQSTVCLLTAASGHDKNCFSY